MTILHKDPSAADKMKLLTASLTKGVSYRNYNDTVRISGSGCGSVAISFQRTVRVPDNQGENNLPPSMGTFPLYPVANYRETLPAEMALKGGLFFPMYQREAMWINFKSCKPFAIKVFLGGVNAVSGEPMHESPATTMRRLTKMAEGESIQDYVVTPEQLWLDGIASKAGLVRQFVAMPLGSGYSVEAQVTGQELTGGMQFLVVPTIPRQVLSRGPRKAGTIRVFVKTLTGKTLEIYNLGSNHTFDDIKEEIMEKEGLPLDKQRLIFAGKQLPTNAEQLKEHSVVRPIHECGIPDGVTMHLVLRLRGGGPGPDPQVLELGIAPGGLIKQCILEDPYPESIWDHGSALHFNVQILNSERFQHVTGRMPPATPISAETYVSHGLPFFDIYNESSKVKGEFQGVKSVVTMDKEKAGKKRSHDDMADELPIATPVVLLNPDGTNQSVCFKPVKVLQAELKSMNHAEF